MSKPGVRAFTEQILALLDEGSRTSTYKFALLSALIDVCGERADRRGRAPRKVAVDDLASKVAELYWHQTRPWRGEGSALRQNSRGQAEILTLLRRFREVVATDDSPISLPQASQLDPHGHKRLMASIRWKLIEMPIPRLQIVGGEERRFIYEMGWPPEPTARQVKAEGFPGDLHLVDGAGNNLLEMAPLLRPLIQRTWELSVARFNQDRVESAAVTVYLFGAHRVALTKVQSDLVEMQGGLCFYCRHPVSSGCQIDHFVPWSRHFDNGLDNLVAAHGPCNNSKRAHLASSVHLARWLHRPQAELAAIAEAQGWERDPHRTRSFARASYLRVPTSTPLWVGRDSSPEPALPRELRELLRTAGP